VRGVVCNDAGCESYKTLKALTEKAFFFRAMQGKGCEQIDAKRLTLLFPAFISKIYTPKNDGVVKSPNYCALYMELLT